MAKKNPFLVPSRKKKKAKKMHAKTLPQPAASVSDINSLVIAEAIASSLAQPVNMKLCRLCETKDGPFLNIFDAEQTISKKIQTLLPFTVTENDDLPHKICFRCSAKVEELHDFVERCTRAQENLRRVLGKSKRPATPPKSNTRKLWEEKLNKSNISNDELCNAVIQKAMEGIKNLPFNPLPLDNIAPKKPAKVADDDSEQIDVSNSGKKTATPVANTKKLEDKHTATKTSRQIASEPIAEVNKTDTKIKPSNTGNKRRSIKAADIAVKDTELKKGNHDKEPIHNVLSSNEEDSKRENDSDDSDDSVNVPIKTIQEKKQEVATEKAKENSKPFNIMDHISIIKVHGVGVLFQCKLCNRNFLKKDVVESHGCAKTGVPKVDFLSTVANVEPVKNPMASVKYINNKVTLEPPKKNPEPVETPPAPEVKQKPKIGPASKTKRPGPNVPNPISNFVGMKVKPREVTPPPQPPRLKAKPTEVTPTPTPSAPPAPPPVPPPVAATGPGISVPGVAGMKTRYRLVPGANNTFTLVEDQVSGTIQPTAKLPPSVPQTKRPLADDVHNETSELERRAVPQPKRIKVPKNPKAIISPTLTSVVIDIDDDPVEAPYPVGFFTTPAKAPMPVPAPVPVPAPKPDTRAPVTFTTPAMKKQSYTIVQTGNPSKLLISTKPRMQPDEEVPKGKGKRKARHEVKEDQVQPEEPYKVTLERAAQPKDNFFTFISLDPLLQPSYVLPTENIIQESQISTSTNSTAGGSKSKDVYECSLCPESFSREKKLLSHLQSHYNKMDDDHDEIVKPNKKRTRKS